MNLLMAIAILGAMALGDWLEAATVGFLFAVSLALESWSVGRARRAIEALLDLAPPRAHRLEADGSLATVEAAALVPGDLFVVKPGERVPLDGEVTVGESEVDESPITGESLPVDKSAGATLWAGTVNGRGAITARATRPATDTSSPASCAASPRPRPGARRPSASPIASPASTRGGDGGGRGGRARAATRGRRTGRPGSTAASCCW